MADILDSELLVIGAGPGGYAAAFLAADKGMQVTLVNSGAKPGGVCLHCGCIPSKALLHAAHVITSTRDAASWGIAFSPPRIDLTILRGRKDKIVETLASHLGELCKRRKVSYIDGRATFVNSTTVQIDNGPQVRFGKCIVATGSSPIMPPSLHLPSSRVLDSTGALKLETVPATLLIVGGGYIGLEMGTVYAALGSQVTVVELTDSLLPGVDADLVKPLATRLQAHFQHIHLNTKVAKLAEIKDGVRATLEGPTVAAAEMDFERVLVAVGRRPNSAHLGLENTRVQLDSRGFVKVDEHRRTTEEHIWAIGDVAGEPMLAHKAAHEGKLAVEVIAGGSAVWEPRAIPAVVFTDPEIAWCGLTEGEAAKQQRPVQIARFHWAASGRATTLGRSDGLSKLIVDPETDRLLGVGLVGPGAGELIGEAVLALEMGATAQDLALSIHPHPTLTETLMEAAESLHGLATHLYKPRRAGSPRK